MKKYVMALDAGDDLQPRDPLCGGRTDVAAVGITNQRETTIVWNRVTGRPVRNAIVWRCRRTSEYCVSVASVPTRAGIGR